LVEHEVSQIFGKEGVCLVSVSLEDSGKGPHRLDVVGRLGNGDKVLSGSWSEAKGVFIPRVSSIGSSVVWVSSTRRSTWLVNSSSEGSMEESAHLIITFLPGSSIASSFSVGSPLGSFSRSGKRVSGIVFGGARGEGS
jgi:hypothetical protein